MKKLLFMSILMFPLIFVTGYCDMASDYPLLPENGRTHYAIYTESSRSGRTELTMFNLPDEIGNDAELIIENGVLEVDCSTLYMDDIKYYLDETSNTWIEFETGYVRISDNVGSLYYSDLNYRLIASVPGGKDKMWNINQAPDGYYVTIYTTEKADFYFTKDFKDYKWIAYMDASRWDGWYLKYDLMQLGYLNGEYVIITNLASYTPPQYKSVGGVYEYAYVYDLNGTQIACKPNGEMTYNWVNNCFDVCVSEVTAQGVSGARGVPSAVTYSYFSSTDLKEYIQKDYYSYYYEEEGVKDIIDYGSYSIVCDIQPLMRYDSSTESWHKSYYYPSGAITLYDYHLRFDNGKDYMIDSENGGRYSKSFVYNNWVLFVSDSAISYSTNGVYKTYIKDLPGYGDSRKFWIERNLVCVYDEKELIMTPIKNNDGVFVCLNDKILGFSQPPIIENDRILVPMRFLFERMNANVDWNNETQTATVTISRDKSDEVGEENTVVTFSINNTSATINGETVIMDVPARLINNKTFVPLRFLSEKLGYNVTWDDAANTATITIETE